MKAILAAAILLGIAGTAPAWAGEGAGLPVDGATPGVSSQMSMKAGGNTDPFRWSAAPTSSQYTVVRGGNTDPFKWSTSPAPSRQASATARNPG